MNLEVNGVLYENFAGASADIRLDALSNSFSFDAVGDDFAPIPFDVGDECRVWVGGEVVLTGHIELVNVDGDADSHSMTFAGRDRTGDIVDSTVTMSDLQPPMTLKAVCEAVITHLTPDTHPSERIQVVDQAHADPFTKAEDLIAPDPGLFAFEVLEQLTRKRATWMTSDADGNLVLLKPTGDDIEAWVHHRKNSADNNVLAYSMSYDQTGRFNSYRVQSELNPDALLFAGESPAAQIVDQQGQAIDSVIREGRQMVLIAESAASSQQNADRATWERNVRVARGRVYTATVAGFTNQTGDLWRINTTPWVISELAGINTRMMLSAVRFSYSVSNGRQSSLTFVDRDAFTIDLEEPSEVTEKEGYGSIFIDE